MLFPDAEHTDPLIGRFRTAYVGHTAAEDVRDQGSSGGLTSWLLAELLRRELVDGVAHVVPVKDRRRERRFFEYRISRTEAEIRAGAKSRYYPVELSDALETIGSAPGRYAVTGIPCFVKAIQLLRREDPVVRERVAFTVGLFCGHMKSARFVESLAWQMGVPLNEVESVDFRIKDPRRPANWYRASLTLRDGRCTQADWWDLADGDWGAGFLQNGACDFCDDVVGETADISLGDAWVEPYSSDGRGTNVVLVRSPQLQELVEAAIRDGHVRLTAVDEHFVRNTQAAALRHRREGLAYRLSRRRRGLEPHKRVAPEPRTITLRRKLIYRMRCMITAWSHRTFWLARVVDRPPIYVGWARVALAAYQALAYSRAPLGRQGALRGSRRPGPGVAHVYLAAGPVNDEDMAKTTTDHEEIRRWVEQRGGRPARVKGTGDDDAGLLRIDFGRQEDTLEAIDWEEWFETFDRSGLAFLYEEEPESRFNKLVSRETAWGRT